MKRPRPFLVILLALLIAGAAFYYFETHPSTDAIAKSVQSSLQNKLATGEFSEFQLKVTRVDVVHEQGNVYQAIATVNMNGNDHDVPLHVTDDGSHMMWQAEPGAFIFIAQAAAAKVMADAAATLAAPQPVPTVEQSRGSEPSSNPNDETQALMDKWDAANDTCRSASSDSQEGQKACSDRDTLTPTINERGWCWGHRDQKDSARFWVRCTTEDLTAR